MEKSIKNVSKTLVCIVVLVLMLSLSACGNNGSNTESKSLYAQGLEIIQTMVEMTRTEGYVDLLTGSNEIKSVIQNIGDGDYTTPKAVYAISATDENFITMFMKMAGLNNLDNVSDELKSYITQKAIGSLMTQVNGMSGVENLAASSVCTVGKTFVNENVNENVIYLYTYDNAAPVAVTFIVGEDHAISASGVFVLYDGFSCGSADEIKSFSFFRGTTVEVTEVLPEK
ncbi:MAG: hypothetical protein K2H31_05560 [Lachnospiraceae bacterium]|nr:hypothetical protein [Lachnospiraceae bacterium]